MDYPESAVLSDTDSSVGSTGSTTRAAHPAAPTVHRSVYLIKVRYNAEVRWHFGILIPNSGTWLKHLDLRPGHKKKKSPFLGTVIHVAGSPVTGYELEFKRNFDANACPDALREVVRIGKIHTALILDPYGKETAPPNGDVVSEETPRCPLEKIAMQIDVPDRCTDLDEPINNTTNRRCQEWTMDFVQLLVSRGYMDPHAIDVVHENRDLPEFGIGLRAVMMS